MAETQLIRLSRPSQRSWLQRMGDSLRSITLGPYNTKDKELARIMGGREASSGVVVNEATAMNYSAVWAAVNLISSHIGAVPLNLYKKTENGRGKEKFDSHPVHRLIHDRPNPHMGSALWRRTLEAHALVWGAGYGEIERDASNRPVAIWPLMPYAVSAFFDGGQLKYRVKNPTTVDTILPAINMLHIRGMHSEDGLTPVSAIGKSRESIGLGLAAERFGGTFFGNGATFGGVISYPVGLATNEQVRKDNREAIEKRHQGVDRAHRLLALYEGAKYEQMGVPPNAAQFLETRMFQIEEICRWFNLPPHKLKHLERSTNNNIEHQGIEYVTDTLDPRWVIWEEELEAKLIPTLERSIQFIEHVREGLLRGDQSARGEFYGKLFSIGAMTPNEIRERENLNPVKGGDTVYVPLNTLPLDRLEEYIDATLKSKTARLTDNPQELKSDPAKDEELAVARKAAHDWEERADLAAAQLSTEQAAHAVTVAARDAAQARVESLTADVVAADGRLRDLEAQAGVLATTLAEADAARDEARAERDAAQAEVETWRQTATAHDAALTEARMIQVEREAERDTALSERDGVLVQVAEARAEVEQVTAMRDAALADVATWTQLAMAHDAALVEARAGLLAREAERDTVLAERDELTSKLADAITAASQMAQERDEQIAGRQADAQAATAYAEAAAAQEQALTAQRDAVAGELQTAQGQLQAASEAAQAEREAQRTQRAVLMTALRGLFVDVTERVLQRELQRMANKRATVNPERLTAWAEEFYPLHRDFCRTAFRPVVAAWVACAGGEADVLLDRLVSQHVGASVRALREAAETDDGDVLAANLARVQRQWETERPGDVADAVVREGMAQ